MPDGVALTQQTSKTHAGDLTTPRQELSAAKPLTVTQLTSRLKAFLETHFGDLLVEGEISGMKPAASGHCYFALKDAGALINCVMFSRDAGRLAKIPQDGEKVEIRGRIGIYDQRGQYQIIVTSMRPAGMGQLFQAFQAMKERLQGEGLFDPARKRPLPQFPSRVGIVTSPTGAAIRDILKVLTRRAPHIEVQIWPCRVQGDGAAEEIAHGIRRLNELNLVDVLIVGRGGGSMEDLWAFNEEAVARAVYVSSIPVISAVGHEIDFTIVDFVADHRAPTPSAAAEVVARNSVDLLRDLQQTTSRLHKAMRQRYAFLREVPHLRARMEGSLFPRVQLMKSRLRQFKASHAVQRPLARLNEMQQRLDDLDSRLDRSASERQKVLHQKHDRLKAQLSALNPKSILSRGYSITFDAQSGQILRSPVNTSPGQELKIILGEGNLRAQVMLGGEGKGIPKPQRKGLRSRKSPLVADWFGSTEKPSE